MRLTLACERIEEVPGKGRTVRLPCSGKIEAWHLLEALEEGYDEVRVLACPLEACEGVGGARRAEARVEEARGILSELGLDPELIRIDHPVPARCSEGGG